MANDFRLQFRLSPVCVLVFKKEPEEKTYKKETSKTKALKVLMTI